MSKLQFSKKRISNDVKKVLQSAIANAEKLGNDSKLYAKQPFLKNFNPDLKVRIDRIKRIQTLVEENIDAFHDALRSDFGTRKHGMFEDSTFLRIFVQQGLLAISL